MNRFETNLIGDRLRFLRKSKGLSQGAAATLLETPISSYKKYELNKSTIPHTILEKIVIEMNTTLSFLMPRFLSSLRITLARGHTEVL